MSRLRLALGAADFLSVLNEKKNLEKNEPGRVSETLLLRRYRFQIQSLINPHN